MSLIGGVEDEIESVLFVQREVSVFKVPPLRTNEGYKAIEWGELDKPLFKGRLRIIEKESTGLVIRVEDSQTGELFAQAPYDKGRGVQPVLDSSRYFVLRVEDPETNIKAYLGIGFAERTESFDFNVALQDYMKRQRAPPSTEDGPSPHIPAGPKKDYSLKEGQTFSISIPGRKAGGLGFDKASSPKPAVSLSGGAIPLLPPPPSAPKRR